MERTMTPALLVKEQPIARQTRERVANVRAERQKTDFQAFGPMIGRLSEAVDWAVSVFARPRIVRKARSDAVQESFNLAVTEMLSAFGTKVPQELLSQAKPHAREFLTCISNFVRQELGPGTQGQIMEDFPKEILVGSASSTARLRAKIKLSLALLKQIETPRAYTVAVLLREALEPVKRAFRVEYATSDQLLKDKLTEPWAVARREMYRPM